MCITRYNDSMKKRIDFRTVHTHPETSLIDADLSVLKQGYVKIADYEA